MSNALITDDVITREALMQLENMLVMGNLVHRDHTSDVSEKGRGGSIRIRKPVQYTVTDGAILDVQDSEEAYATLTLDKRKHVAMEFSTQERTLTVEEFSSRYIKPAVIQLANQVDTDILALFYRIYNATGTPSTAFNSYADFLAAVQRKDEMSIPNDGRIYSVMNPTDYYGLVGILPSLESPGTKGGTALEEASLGRKLGGVMPYLTQNMPTLTHSTASTVCQVATDNQNVTYATAKNTWSQDLDIDTLGGSTSFAAGQIFTIAGVKAVNPVSKATYAHEQQFTILTATSGTSTATLSISPPIITSGPYQTVDHAPSDGDLLTFLGTAATHRQNIMFHKNALTLAMAPLYLPSTAGASSRMSDKGLSIRMTADYNITNDVETHRLDILYGVLLQDPRLALRLYGVA